MPRIYRFECTLCPQRLPGGWGRCVYAVDAEGRRHVCPHPGEFYEIERITGLDWQQAMATGRAGVLSDCLCSVCFATFGLDLERDVRVCPDCGRQEVWSTEELVGQTCPRCGAGKIVAIDTRIIS